MMPDQIKVGDKVIWRRDERVDTSNGRLNPLGIANCTVIELRDGLGGVQVAKVRLAGDREVVALLSDLHAQ